MISWIWGGALVMALGGVVSLTDRRWRVGAASRPRRPVTQTAAAE
jgi:cytochrome c-type biogenesis protein CcmF